MAQGISSLDSEPSWEGRQVFSQLLCFGPWSIQLMFWAIKKEMVGLLSLTTLSLWFKYFSPVNVLGYFWTIFSPIKGTKLRLLWLCFREVLFEKCCEIAPPFRKPVKSTLNATYPATCPKIPPLSDSAQRPSPSQSLFSPYQQCPANSRGGQYTQTASVSITVTI